MLTPEQEQAFISEYYTFIEAELEDQFDDMLDEIYPQICIGNIRFSASRVLNEMDPTAYRCWFSDFLDDYHKLNNGYYAQLCDLEEFMNSWGEEEEEEE